MWWPHTGRSSIRTCTRIPAALPIARGTPSRRAGTSPWRRQTPRFCTCGTRISGIITRTAPLPLCPAWRFRGWTPPRPCALPSSGCCPCAPGKRDGAWAGCWTWGRRTARRSPPTSGVTNTALRATGRCGRPFACGASGGCSGIFPRPGRCSRGTTACAVTWNAPSGTEMIWKL